jgi:hypothetical protein
MLNPSKTQKLFTVYWLVDLTSKKPFYVGVTGNDPFIRYQSHLRYAKKGNYKRDEAIRSRRFLFDLVVVEHHPDKITGFESESYWIYQLKEWGFDLANRIIGSPSRSHLKNKETLNRETD